jgi:hypothetical protein
MLVGLSLVLSRAKRAGQLVPIIPVDTHQLVADVLLAMAHQSARIVLEVPTSAPAGTFELAQVLLQADHKVEGAVLYSYHHTNHHQVPQHVTDIALHVGDLGSGELRGVVSATDHPAALVLHSERFPNPNHLRALLDRHPVALRLPVLLGATATNHRPTLDAVHLNNIVQSARVPLLAAAHRYSPDQLQVLHRAGFSGYTISVEELHEAYLAGLRTGLRDRSQRNLAVIHRPASLAVQQVLKRYLTS